MNRDPAPEPSDGDAAPPHAGRHDAPEDPPGDAPRDDAPKDVPSSAGHEGRTPRSRDTDRLPPPMFPPGARRPTPRAPTPATPLEDDSIPQDALILPDQPIRRETGAIDLEDVLVTGIGDDPHLEDELDTGGPADPHLEGIARAVERLARALRQRGEPGLRTTPDMTPFEATLRAYCLGYLTRAREGDRSG
jgi:hypothetical protein